MDIGIALGLGLLLGAGIVYFLLNRELGKTQQKLAGLESQREAELKAAGEA